MQPEHITSHILMHREELIKKADIQKISSEGARIYESLKSEYEPKHNGKFLAIDIETKNVYLADDGAQAVELARMQHPDKVFYLVKIGSESAQTQNCDFRKSMMLVYA